VSTQNAGALRHIKKLLIEIRDELAYLSARFDELGEDSVPSPEMLLEVSEQIQDAQRRFNELARLAGAQ